MNIITIAEIKRGGMGALDVALSRGAATIMKRNRPAAIVLTPQSYDMLLAQVLANQQTSAHGSALDWLLNASNAAKPGSSSKLADDDMGQRINGLKTGWLER